MTLGIAGSQPEQPCRRTERRPAWSSRNVGMCAARPSSTAASAWGQISPLPPFLGWDTIDEARARRRLACQVCSVDPRGSRRSTCARPAATTASCAATAVAVPRPGATAPIPLNVLAQRPCACAPATVVGGLAYLGGWLGAAVRRAPRAEPEVVSYVQHRQLKRIQKSLTRSEATAK